VELAPTVWINWQLLGNYLSDIERYDEAASAYDEAFRCPGADESSIRLNQAILAARRHNTEQVLYYADSILNRASSKAAKIPSFGWSTRMLRSARYKTLGLRCSPVRFHLAFHSFQQI
jgi:hypothetical protein